ncbi:hypothetical protein [Pseudomonas bubulae]|uniref:hypothetical protein n=1 Tax=Pseudomonas bubulae TaxID=2316085 RepID=UPI00309E1058
MSAGFTEDDMRRALGLDLPAAPVQPEVEPAPAKTIPAPKKAAAKRSGPVLRVTMRVTKVFDGDESLFVHDSKDLSRFNAEQEAKKALAKAGFKYFELESIVSVD